MSSTYKRLLNEYKVINELKDKINYKIHTINSNKIMFRCDLNFIFNKVEYNIKIYYTELYPIKCPLKLEINNINIFDLYKKIMSKNKILFNKKCLSCNSLLCNNNWNITKNILDILDEIKKVISYNELHIKRFLLNKITLKYTKEHLDYLEQYLL
jgi:hypothetical protein